MLIEMNKTSFVVCRTQRPVIMNMQRKAPIFTTELSFAQMCQIAIYIIPICSYPRFDVRSQSHLHVLAPSLSFNPSSQNCNYHILFSF